MNITVEAGAIAAFWRSTPQFQLTVRTPLKETEHFARIIGESIGALQGGQLIIENVVFPPKHLPTCLPGPQTLRPDTRISVGSAEAFITLLDKTLQDWIDFAAIPEPGSFTIYADHDEYCTFLATSQAGLDQVIMPLRSAGFQVVNDFQRSQK